MPTPAPTSRRERRELERAAERGRRRAVRIARAVQPGAALLVATAFLAGGVTGTVVEQQQRARVQADEVASRDAAEALAARVSAAATTRLAGQAAAWTAGQRAHALAVAEEAVATAQTVAAQAQPVVDPATLGPLDAAVQQLTALVATTPVEVAGPAAPAAPPEPAAAPAPLPVEPGADAVALLAAADAAAPRDAVVPTVDAGVTDGASAPVGTLRDDQVSRSLAARSPLGDAPTADVDRSAQVVAAAEQVLALSAQVQAAAEAALAAAAQAAAEEAARAAAAAALAARVAAVQEQPNGQVDRDLLCGVDFDEGVQLRCDAAAALEELDEAYHDATGRHLDVSSSYRDLAEQAGLRATKGGLAGLPGTSNHGRAVAVDLAGAGSLGQFDAPLYLWLAAHADDFGWEHPEDMEPGGSGPLEPWHWEFVG